MHVCLFLAGRARDSERLAVAERRAAPLIYSKDTLEHDPDDLISWPDGTMCFRSELCFMAHMSDDYFVFRADTPEWLECLQDFD